MAELTPQDYARGCLLRIVAQPGRYDQETWQTIGVNEVDFRGSNGVREVECPTTGCVAGTAAMLAGDRGIANEFDRTMRNGKEVISIGKVITEGGSIVGIKDRGRQLLNLSYDDADWLFSGTRLLPEVVNALIELSEGRPLSRKHQSAMTGDEIRALKNYRVPPVVRRQSVPAEPAVPTRVAQVAHQE